MSFEDGISARLLLVTRATSVSEISRILGMKPDSEWHVGEPRTKRIATPHADSAWILEVQSAETIDLASVIDQLVDRFESVAEKVKLLPEQPKIYLSCGVS